MKINSPQQRAPKRFPMRLAIASCVVVAFSGCAQLALHLPEGPKAVAAPAMPTGPERWQFEPESKSLANWATLADDELLSLLKRADAANRDLSQAALRLNQARSAAEQGNLRLTPSASVGVSASRPLDPPGGFPARTNQNFSASVGVGYEFDLWGRIAALRQADSAQIQAAQTDVRAARLLVRQRVADAYWQIAAARQQRALAQEQLTLNRELIAATQLRVREGRLLPIEVDRAAATLQQAQTRLTDLDADTAQQRLTLALLLNEAPPGPSVASAQFPKRPPIWRVGADPSTVLERRPDVQRARAQVDAAAARASATEAARYPSLRINASFGTSGDRIPNWLNNPLISVANSLAIPLIDWKRLDLQRTDARTELELAALALRDTVAKAIVEIEVAWIEGQRIEDQLASNAVRMREVEAAERIAALRLEVGTLARADFLQAKNARLEAEQGRLQLQLRALQNRSALAKALAWD